MKLNERLRQTEGTKEGTPVPDAPARANRETLTGRLATAASSKTVGRPAVTIERRAEPGTGSGPDPLSSLKQRAQDALYARLGSRLYRPEMTAPDLQDVVVDELTAVLEAERVPLTASERQQLVDDITEDVLGFGPIARFLEDPEVTEIMVNSTRQIYVERGGRIYATGSRFLFEEHLRRVIERVASQVGRRIDESSPMVDARLPDGSRVNAIIPPLAVDGPTLTIRRFATVPFRVEDLVRMGTMTQNLADLLALCVKGQLNILISGGTGTGKTTLLNVLSCFIPVDERIVTIEDACELRLNQEHVVRLESRPPNIEDRGEVTIRDLVRNSLRMRPDRIVVGECRGPEALDMLQAMNTGHEGSLSTVHANSPRDALNRLETMVLMAGLDLPSRAIREQIVSAVDLLIHMTRLRDGSRKITQVTEVSGMESGTITLQDLFMFEFGGGVNEEGRMKGFIRATGIRPSFSDRLADRGFPLPGTLLSPAEPTPVKARARAR